ncbi:MAG TPA: hypothetical protein VIC32_07195 [Terriglobales bacterium]
MATAIAVADFDLAEAHAFRPTSDQRRLLNNIHDNPSIRTIREFCEQCDISRSTYYNWCKNPHFRLWFATAWSSRMLVEGITLLNQARAKASYKFQYWKALADLTFDPNGMALLQKWQQAMFSLDGTAFDCGPEAAFEYDYHFDPTSECNDHPRPQNPAPDVKSPPDAPLANPAENWTFQANRTTATASADCPTPVAVARVFRKALASARRYSCIAHRHAQRKPSISGWRGATAPGPAPIKFTPKPKPQQRINCLTETISSTSRSAERVATPAVPLPARTPTANRLITPNAESQKLKPEQGLNCLTETIARLPVTAERKHRAMGPDACASISGWRGVSRARPRANRSGARARGMGPPRSREHKRVARCNRARPRANKRPAQAWGNEPPPLREQDSRRKVTNL